MTRAAAQLAASDLLAAGYVVSVRIEPINEYVVTARDANGGTVTGAAAQTFATNHSCTLQIKEAEYR